jgi:dTDP-4-dehydrorhamnose 3,5-epimerase-like enzyme
MITEQTEITVTFKITELLHLYDQLIIAHDYADDENKTLCVYLCDRLWNQIPEFEESINFYDPIVPKDYKSNF